MSPLNITQPLDSIRYMVYNGYYKVMSNIPKMGHLTTPDLLIKQVDFPWGGVQFFLAWRLLWICSQYIQYHPQNISKLNPLKKGPGLLQYLWPPKTPWHLPSHRSSIPALGWKLWENPGPWTTCYVAPRFPPRSAFGARESHHLHPPHLHWSPRRRHRTRHGGSVTAAEHRRWVRSRSRPFVNPNILGAKPPRDHWNQLCQCPELERCRLGSSAKFRKYGGHSRDH